MQHSLHAYAPHSTLLTECIVHGIDTLGWWCCIVHGIDTLGWWCRIERVRISNTHTGTRNWK